MSPRAGDSHPTRLESVLAAIARTSARMCEARDALIFLVEGDGCRVAARYGPMRAIEGGGRYSFRARVPVAEAIRERRPVHVRDLAVAARTRFPDISSVQQVNRVRTVLAMPLLKDGAALGGIVIRRKRVRPFTPKQIALLRTFADQAAIAIENARLFKELEARNSALTAALEQQTATAEVLRIISSSPTDVQPVFDTIIDRAIRLMRGTFGAVYRFDGTLINLAAVRGWGPEVMELARRSFPMPPGDGSLIARAIRDRHIIQVADSEADPALPSMFVEAQRLLGARSCIAVPIFRDGVPVGGIVVARAEAAPFPDKQIDLVKTFADQAVIAIENVRLFNETKEALEQQTATAEILRVISSSPTDIQPVLEAVAENAAKLCSAPDALIRRVEGAELRLVAHFGPIPIAPGGESVPLTRDMIVGRAVIDCRAVHVPDPVEEHKRGNYLVGKRLQLEVGFRTTLAVPLLRQGTAIGAILIRRMEVRPFTDKQIALIETFAAQAVIAIENVRLFTELRARNRDLTEALEQQTATSEILRVISSSPTDVQPVFDAIARSAAVLCGASAGAVFRLEDDVIDLVAHHSGTPEWLAVMRRIFPAKARERPPGWAALERAIVHFADVENDPRTTPGLLASARAAGYRRLLLVPMHREGAPLGAIGVSRPEPGPFSDKQIALLQTFADQAVIAIENVRLFNELQARTQELTRSVGQLTALGEVGQAVSSTLDLETVLTTIVSRAVQLTGSDGGTIFEYDEATEQFHQRAAERLSVLLETDAQRREVGALFRPWADALGSRLRIKKGEGVVGRLPEARKPIQVGDIAAAGAYQGPLQDALLESGIRAVLTVPLMSEERLVGALTVNRKTAGVFSPEVIELLQTFAAQSAIAIQNARLFRELEAKGRELEEASRHKSQFLANMSHELRTPMNAILGYTELMADGIYGGVPEPMRDVLTRVEASGRHLLGLINDVLDLSKIEAGALTLTLAEYSMKEVVEAVVGAVESLAAEKRLRLVVDLAPDLPTGRGDQRRLAQVLLNLVGNAIKFTEAGQIAIRVGAAGGFFTVAVSDTGPGIAPADQERIFEEFQQADTSTTRPKGGTGLGLAIARRIVAMHGGRIWVESVPGEGATFRFTLPVRVEQQAVLRTAAP